MTTAIPGLQLPGLVLGGSSAAALPHPSAGAASTTPVVRTEDLPPHTEYRFEVSFSQTLRVKLLSGTAELFGTELAPSASLSYAFNGTKAAIYTWHGCRLELEGECESEYVAEETKMMEAANVHFALENARTRAAATSNSAYNTQGIGPRVLIVGPENAGKTTLAKILTAYAVKGGRQPVVVNLDPRQGLLSVPGSFSAAAFAHILDVEEGWGSSPISGPSAVPVKMPLVYHFGLQAPDAAGRVFRPLVTRAALTVTSRMQEDADVRAAGCIIDTPGVIAQGKGGSYDSILHIISEFSVNVVLVLGSERVYSDLSRRFSKSGDEPVSIIKLDKSGGCVDREESYMKQLRANQIRTYFFGTKAIPLNPHTHWEDFSALSIYRIINADETTNASFLPGNDYYEDSANSNGPPRIYDLVQPTLAIQNSILAVTNADPNESQQGIRDSSVLCYVYVSEVDEAKRRIRLLAPTSGRIPARAMILGRWPEDVVDLVG